jgi:hypothetical protein
MTDELKDRIDKMSYHDMLVKWRFAPVGDPMFTSAATAHYFRKIMTEKRHADPAGAVAASKCIGWPDKGEQMFNITFHNDFFTVGQTVCKLLVLRNQHLEATKEINPELIVFLGEREDNPGETITKNIGALAQTVYEGIGKPIGIKPWEVCWVECCLDDRPTTMDIITFKHDREIGAGECWEDPQRKGVALDHPFLRGF